MTDLKHKIEALLFASGRKMKVDEIAKLCNATNIDDVKSSLYQLKEEYDKRDSSLMLFEEGNAWKLNVKERHLDVVHSIVSETELSKSLMETLAVIAWKYPVLQSEVIHIRTNKAYDHLKELEEMGFISRSVSGRTKKIKLTDKFFTYFDLPSKERAQAVFRRILPDEIKEKIIRAEKEIMATEKAIEEALAKKVEQAEQEKKEEEEQKANEEALKQELEEDSNMEESEKKKVLNEVDVRTEEFVQGEVKDNVDGDEVDDEDKPEGEEE
ncbi:SMC-Scp complex subunit ScpB [Candidatus Woesearchaeota archaeon]|nr:SMC-Scp complex subunit ScpB [Candidatus Woesearchaeota archaeon]